MDINNSRTLSQAIVESKTNNDVIYYPIDSNSVVINGIALTSNSDVTTEVWKNGDGDKSTITVGNKDNGGNADGDYSVAEGLTTKSQGIASHAEGNQNTAVGNYSHVEGQTTKANGACSHAEGSETIATGNCAHAEGLGTFTQNEAEHAEGRYNVSHKTSEVFGDAGNTQHSIGIGQSMTAEGPRYKNAVEIMQNGDAYLLGLGNYDGTNPTNADSVQTIITSKLNKTIINIVDIYNVTDAEKDSIYAQKDNIYNTVIVSDGVTYNIATFSFEEDGAFFLVVLNANGKPIIISKIIYKMVDLGLPSGLKWAKQNIGAPTETGYGDYFMFGSTTPNTNNKCDWVHAPFNNGQDYYDEDYFLAHKDEWFNNNVLKPEYDAATQIMGSGWRMPTQDDLYELIDGTTSEWVENYNDSGVNGRLFTSTANSNSIFIPASGGRHNLSVDDENVWGEMWSSFLDPDYLSQPWYLEFNDADCGATMDRYRYYGYSVRGVHE